MQNLKEHHKIIFVIGILIILAVGIFIIRSQKQKEVEKITQTVVNQSEKKVISPTIPPVQFDKPGTYQLILSVQKVKVGEKFEAKLQFLAKDKIIFGSDVIIRFDPTLLEVKQENIIVGDYFTNYTRKTVDMTKGLVKVTAIRPKEALPMTDYVVFATISLTAKKSGMGKIDFDFQKGKTNLTTLVEQGTSRNILGEAKGGTIIIE